MRFMAAPAADRLGVALAERVRCEGAVWIGATKGVGGAMDVLLGRPPRPVVAVGGRREREICRFKVAGLLAGC